MAKQRSKLAKIFIWIALVLICWTVISPFIMYFWASNNTVECEEWYARNENTQQCEEIEYTDWEETAENKDSCEIKWGTWYEENNICILPNE